MKLKTERKGSVSEVLKSEVRSLRTEKMLSRIGREDTSHENRDAIILKGSLQDMWEVSRRVVRVGLYSRSPVHRTRTVDISLHTNTHIDRSSTLTGHTMV